MQYFDSGTKSENIEKTVIPKPINFGGCNFACNIISYENFNVISFSASLEPSATLLFDFRPSSVID